MNKRRGGTFLKTLKLVKAAWQKLEWIWLLKRGTTVFPGSYFLLLDRIQAEKGPYFPGMMGLPSWIKVEERRELHCGREECFPLKSFSDPFHDPALVRLQGPQKENSRWKFGRAEQLIQLLSTVGEMGLAKLEAGVRRAWKHPVFPSKPWRIYALGINTTHQNWLISPRMKSNTIGPLKQSVKPRFHKFKVIHM